MEVGAQMFSTDVAIRPDHLARELEARGFDALFLPEHTHIPVSRRTPYPGGGELPEEYRRTHDVFVALTAAAAATERLTLGTGICLVGQRDHIVLAKEVASLDVLSNGRFVFGIGYGWNHDEMENHGLDPRRRRAIVREKVLAMEALWTDEEAAFDGEHVHLAPSWFWPKPRQRPRPPVLIGGAAGPTLFRHIAEFADGWIPIGGGGLSARLDELREQFAQAGRDPASLQVTVVGADPSPGKLEHLAALGVGRFLISLPPAPDATVLPLLDRYAEGLGALRSPAP
jgi:probable F420-dependent oxidoreductase